MSARCKSARDANLGQEQKHDGSGQLVWRCRSTAPYSRADGTNGDTVRIQGVSGGCDRWCFLRGDGHGKGFDSVLHRFPVVACCSQLRNRLHPGAAYPRRRSERRWASASGAPRRYKIVRDLGQLPAHPPCGTAARKCMRGCLRTARVWGVPYTASTMTWFVRGCRFYKYQVILITAAHMASMTTLRAGGHLSVALRVACKFRLAQARGKHKRAGGHTPILRALHVWQTLRCRTFIGASFVLCRELCREVKLLHCQSVLRG